METFELTFETVNAAFGSGNHHYEIARILRNIADSIEREKPSLASPLAIADINGNRIGTFFTT